MTVYTIPRNLHSICFDIDRTLYTNEDFAGSQVTLLKRRLGLEKGWTEEQVERELALVKEQTEGAQSHGNWFKMLGVPIATSVEWRKELIRPEDFLKPDEELRGVLSGLPDSVSLCALTNNPGIIGRRTLASLGVEDLFSFTIGLDDTGFSKPSPEPFVEIERRSPGPPQGILMVGDRYDVDLKVPLDRGWGGILVDGVGDVYGIPELLSSQKQ